jgi:signal transduction protein with GAF and PtsI domain
MNWTEELQAVVARFHAEAGTIHLLGGDGNLHLAATVAIPPPVAALVQVVPIGKGMAGLAAERLQAVTACNIQTDTSGDVRPGARATGLEGAIALPMLDGEGRLGGVLGIANRTERTFTPDEQSALLALGQDLLRRAT